MSACRSCGAPIVWATTANRKRMPVDAAPSARGTIMLRDGKAHVMGSLEALSLRDAGVELHEPHHATCPDARLMGIKWHHNAPT